MPTKYDVFARIIEKAPCRIKDLDFEKSVYAHVNSLKNNNLIVEKNNVITPVKNSLTNDLFKVIKYSLNNGLDYNLLFSKSTKKVLKILPSSLPNLRPDPLKGNKEANKVLKYLEQNQFILKYSKRPAQGRMLKHRILNSLASMHKIDIKLKKIPAIDIIPKISSLRVEPVNPFQNRVFSFLAGSAQLEGSTITEGETIELLLKDIYPDKSAKDIQMVKNLNEAMKYVIENLWEEITPERIMRLNSLIMFSFHSNAGKYKRTWNKIEGNPSFKTAPPGRVPELIVDFCSLIKTEKNILPNLGYLHNEFQRIHPFSDGNSRTTRMIVNWILLKNNLPMLVIKMGAFDEYMGLTKLSIKRDDESLNQLLLELLWHESL